MSQARWDADQNDDFMGAPDLVIEVLSPSNTMDEILDRQDICLSNGCMFFWVVDPKRQTIMATVQDRTTRTYARDSRAPLPGLVTNAIGVWSIFKQ